MKNWSVNGLSNGKIPCAFLCAGLFIFIAAAGISSAAHTQNILITGYWPPTNEMLRKFSTNVSQNPGGWQGQNWEGRGYDVYSYFPEFPGGTGSNPKGNGDFEIDYQDVGSWNPPSAPTGDFWRITGQVHPVAILSYGQGDGPWEMEINARNLPSASWQADYLSPTKPSPAPPDTTQASGYVRHSSLPVDAIAEAVNSSGAGINAWIDWDGNPGAFLCEYMAYHDGWYQSIHGDPCDQYYCMAAGFTHLAAGVNPSNGTTAVEAALRALISQLDSQLFQYTVSGAVTAGGSPLAGVTMCGLPGNPVTNGSGVYTAQVGGGWSGVVTPLKSGYAFAQKTYSNIRANQSAQDYTTSAAAADTIAFDAASSASSATAATTLSWSHTVGTGENRVIVVGAVCEDSVAADQIISSVKFNGVNMTTVAGSKKSRGNASSTLRTDLYYMLNPPVGTYTVLITYNGSVSYRVGGAVSLINVKQQAPEAVAANAATATTVSTSVTIPNNGAWIVDVVGHSNSGTFTTSTSTERWDKNSGYHTGACSTKAITTPGSNTITWTYSGSSGTIAHSLAAFAPSETIASSPPEKATSPSPANSATGVGITTDLSWTADSGATSHDVYFGSTNPPQSRGNQAGTAYDTGTMANNTTYYWRVDEKNAGGTTTGDVWSFATVPAAPGSASSPNPAAGSTNVGVTTDLGWTAGSGATSHDVYFGTANPPQSRGNQAGTTYDTGTMANNTTYYWRIDEKNTGGTTTGTVWSFTTIVKRTLTNSSTTGGDVTTPGEGAFQYDNGTVANLVATPDAHYHFVNWTGTAVTAGKVASPTSASTTVTMDGDYTVVANFAIDQKALTTSAGTNGAVTTPGTGTFNYNYNAAASIAAAPNANYHFVNWTGTAVTAGKVVSPASASTTVTMDGDYTVVANFAIDQKALTTSAGANGTVTTPGSGTFNYNYNTAASIVAAPNANYHFVSWTGTAVTAGKVASPTSASTTVTMDGDYTVAANFAIDQYTIAASAGANGSINPSGGITKNYGDSQLFTAASVTDYTVDKWSVDGSDVQAGGATYTLSGITAAHTVTVSFKILTYIVPNVVGQTQADANAAITAIGNLTVGTVTQQYDNTAAAGSVISQNPIGGTVVNTGSSVSIVVSLGRPAVPNVVGLTPAAATSAVTAVSLTVGTITSQYSNSVATGLVISQNPAADTLVNIGSAVDTVISLGKPVVPYVVGMTQTNAATTITSVTLIVGTVTEQYDNTVPAGSVISQSPSSGTSVDIGFAVDLVVSLGRPVVPNVVAMTEADANSAITAVGNFTVGTITDEYSDTVAAGVVISQDPNGYTQVAIGTAINIVISLGPQPHMIAGCVLDSDSLPLAGVKMNGLPDDPCTDDGGYYSAVVDNGWSGEVTPMKYAYGFTPPSIDYNNVVADQNNQDYAGRLLTFAIWGYTLDPANKPVSGVIVTADNGGGADVTDANGFYELWVPYNWSGNVMPSKAEYAFAPANKPYGNVLADQQNQDYMAASIYDLDPDGVIDLSDFGLLVENWLASGQGDFDNNKIVNLLDFARFGEHWLNGY